MTVAAQASARPRVLRIGTRASALALAQSRVVADRLAVTSGLEVELVPITSAGDRTTESLASLGGTGVFATGLREALRESRCDVVVHSFKDLPTEPAPGLRVAAVPKRADARDALCARDGLTLDTLPDGARSAPDRHVVPRSCVRVDPNSTSSTSAATSTPVSAWSPPVRWTPWCSPPPASSGSGGWMP